MNCKKIAEKFIFKNELNNEKINEHIKGKIYLKLKLISQNILA